MSKIKYPPTLVKQSNLLIKKKFKDYKNSWMNTYSRDWWDRRLETELKEYLISHDKKELLDIINICRMIYATSEKECGLK